MIRSLKGEKLIKGGDFSTTNNRMEMIAVIEATRMVPDGSEVVVYSDSKYIVDGISKWLPKWKMNDWRTSAKKPVKNSDLWLELDEANNRLHIVWKWVKGHSGHPENEIVDSEAQRAARRMQLRMKTVE